MNAAPNSSLLDRVARAIHEAKIKSCWMKSAWDSRLRAEPWEKPNPASPNQPWHDISIDQATAALDACHAEELIGLLRECVNELEAEVEARYVHDGKIHPANAGRYARDMTPVMNARALLDKLEGR